MMSLDRRLHAYRADLAESGLRGQVDAAAFADGEPFRVTAPVLPLRGAPRPGASLDTELLFGEDVTVFDRRDGWSWIKAARDGYVGYAPNDGLTATESPTPATHRVATLRTFLFSRPDLKVPPVKVLHHGSLLRIGGRSGDYYELESGGFVYAAHIRSLEKPDTDPVETARLYLHTPYLWGGRSSLGLDCSALVQLAWMACGIPCPRDSDMQRDGFGDNVPYAGDESVLKRGDLVFWKGHVGIWIAPESFLHANASDMCVAERAFAQTAAHIEQKGEGPVIGVRRPPMPVAAP